MTKTLKKIGVACSLLLLVGGFSLGSETKPDTMTASAATVVDGTLTLNNTGSWPGGLGRHNVHHGTYVEVADTEDLVIEYEVVSATEEMQRFGLVKGLQDVTDEMQNYDAYLEMVLSNGKKDVYSGFCMPGATELNTYSNRSAAVREYMLANGSASYNSSDASYGLNYHTSGWGANLGKKQGMATADVKYKHIFAADGHYEMWVYNADNPNGKKIMYTAPTFASSANQRTGITMPDAIKANDEKIFVNRSGYIGFWANHSAYNIELDNFKVSVMDQAGNETVKINETYDYTVGGSEYDINNWVYTKSGASTWNIEKPRTQATKIVYGADASNWNNADYSYGGYDKTLIMYAHDANGSIKLDTSFDVGNFNSNIQLNGLATSEIKFTLGAHSANGSSPLFLQYKSSASFINATEENYATLKIPAGTTLYNIEFAQDVELYFYDGLWRAEKPVTELVYTAAEGVAIADSFNHAEYNGKQVTVLYARDESNKSIALDYSYPAGNFATNVLLNGEATNKFSLMASGGHSANGSTPLHIAYAKDATLFANTQESYLTLTIPQGTTLYNIRFEETINLYFFNGKWQLTQPNVPASYKAVNGITVYAGYNHKDKWGHKNTLWQLTQDGMVLSMDKTYSVGNFFDKATIEINGVTTSLKESQFTFRINDAGHGAKYFEILYGLNGAWVDPAEGEMYTVTIPVGTIAYDYKFTQETKIYFYNGVWQVEPMPEPEELVYDQAYGTAIQSNLNHTTASGKKVLVIYAYPQDSSTGYKLNYAYPAGTFNTNLLLNGVATDKFTFKATGGHSGDGQSPIHISYAIDETLFATTKDSYLTLTIPEGTTLYNVQFAQDLNLYFYNGAWQTTKPNVPNEYKMVNGVAIQAGWNHVNKYGGMYTLLKLTASGSNTSMDKNYEVGTFFDKATIEINGVTTSIANSKFAFKSYNAGHGATYFDVLYCTNTSWVNPADNTAYVITIPAGTTAYDCKFETEVKLYFVDGEWNVTNPNIPAEYTMVENITVLSYYNHIDKNSRKNTLLQFISNGQVVSFDKTTYIGTFFKNATIEINGVTTTLVNSQFAFANADSGHGATYFEVIYGKNNTWVDPVDGEMYVITIPAGTTAHNYMLANDVTLYFYDGGWTTVPKINAPVMTTGASIRIEVGNATRSGIKFQANVSKATINYFNMQKENGEIEDVYYGTIITAKDLLDNAGLFAPTIENMDATNVYYKNIIASGFNPACETSTTSGFYASLVGIQSSNYYRTWVARSYIAVVVDGETTYYWANYSEVDNARSVYNTAAALYNGSFYNSLDADSKAVIDGYVDGVVDITLSNGVAAYAGTVAGYTAPYTVSVSGYSMTITSTAYIHSLVINGKAVAMDSVSADGKTATYTITPSLNSGETMMLSAYGAPDTTADQDAAYQAMAEAGITHLIIFPTENATLSSSKFNTDPFVYGEKYGIKIIPFTANLQNNFSKYYAQWMTYSSFGGVFAYDEPGASTEAGLAEVKASIQAWIDEYTAACPNMPYYINLYPNYATSSQIGKLSYANYVAYFSDILYAPTAEDAGIWCDIYPLTKQYGRYAMTDTWLSNLETLRAEAEKNNTDLYVFIQTIDYDSRRLPTEEDIRFQAYVSMAYGVEGISYFCYQTPYWATTFEDSTGAVTDDGQLTDVYYAIQNVSEELMMFDQTYLAFDWQAVVKSANCTSTNVKNCTNMYTTYGDLKGVTSTSDSVVGCFEDENGFEAYMVVNFTDPASGTVTKTNTVTLTLDSSVKQVVVYDNGVKTFVDVVDGKITLTLEAGEGQFVVPYVFG